MAYKKVKSWIANNKYNFILISLSLVALILFQFANAYLCYRKGINNKSVFGTLLVLGLSQIVTFLVISFLSMVNLIKSAFKAIKTKTVSWKKLSLSACTLLISLLVFQIFLVGKPGVDHYLRGYEKWVTKQTDIPAIREWLNSLPVEYSGKASYEIDDYPQNLPETFNNLNHEYWYLSDFNDGRTVELVLGGGFMQWGIKIGMEDMETPNKVGFVNITEEDRELRRPIEPGVYVFMRE